MDPLATRLRAERERQGLSVRDVSVVTKIREPYIEAIERGRYDVLPAVYVRSFVKTIATSLGIPDAETRRLADEVFEGNEEALRLPRSIPPQQPPPGLESTVQKAGEVMSATVAKATEVVGDQFKRLRALRPPGFFTDRPRFIMLLALLGAVALVVVFVMLIASGGEDESTGQSAPDSAAAVTVTDQSSEGGSGSPLDSMHLTAEVMDTSWITITMDGMRTQQQVLAPGNEYEWVANEKFVINVTNAGGVRFFRDGEPLPLFGKRGEAVRSVRITRTDVVSSAQTSAGQRRISSPTPTPTAQPAPTRTPPPQPRSANRQNTRKRNSRPNIPIITPAPTRPPR